MKNSRQAFNFFLYSIFALSVIVCSCDDDLDICSGIVDDKSISFQGQKCEFDGVVFKIVENNTSFGNGDSDLRNYFMERINLCGLEKIKSGKIIIFLTIDKQGSPCLRYIRLLNVFLNNANHLADIVNSMPLWNPGDQRGNKVNQHYTIGILIEDGVITFKG